MNEYDIIVIGAGPAGSTFARLLAGKSRILLLDRAQPKCCGGLLAPDAQEMIARLGLVLPDTVLEGPQLFSVLVDDYDNQLQRYYQRHYINVNRERFDTWLLSLVPENVDLCVPGRCHTCEWDDATKSFTVNFHAENKPETAKAKILVGADGAFSMVRRQFFTPREGQKMYTAIQHWYEYDIPSPCYGAIFDRDVTDYYSWTIPKGNRLIIGSAIPNGPDVKERFSLLLEKISRTKKLGPLVRRETAQLLRPMSMMAPSPVAKNLPVALLGEAAGWISPSSAEGISYAMRSAVALADALSTGIDGFEKRYKKKTLSLNVNIFLKNLKKPAMFSPALRKFILRTGLLSLDVLPPDSHGIK